MTNPIAELETLEAHRDELAREQSGLERRRGELDRERADLEARAAKATDLDELRKLEEQIAENGLWQRVAENRRPGLLRDLHQISTDVDAARAAANRHRVAGLIVETDAVFARILASIEELAAMRGHAVEAGAPTTLLAPPPGGDLPNVHSDVDAFTLVDRLAVHLRGAWAKKVLPEAHRDLK